MKNIITTISMVAIWGLACPLISSGHEEKETTLKSSDVPTAVQKAVNAEAKGGKIIRWEKEGSNYEAVIEKNGKQTGVKVNAGGKIMSRHDEGKEKGEKY